MISRIFNRYNREMKEVLKKGDETRLLALASCSAALIAKTRHDLGQFYTLASRGGPGSYKKALYRLELLSSIQEKERAFFALLLFATEQRDAASVALLLEKFKSKFIPETPKRVDNEQIPAGALALVLAPALVIGIDPGLVFAVARHFDVIEPIMLAHIAAHPEIDSAAWQALLAAAVKAGLEPSFSRKAAIQFARAKCPELALAMAERVEDKFGKSEALREVIPILTAAGHDTDAFSAFLKLGQDMETYQDDLAMPILLNLLKKERWLEAVQMLPRLPNKSSRGWALRLVIARLSDHGGSNEEIWQVLGQILQKLDIYTMIRGRAGRSPRGWQAINYMKPPSSRSKK